MPGERLSMRKIREVLRLRLGHQLSQRAVADSLRMSVGAVNGYLSRARRAGLGWPLPDDLDDERLERLLFPPPPDVPAERRPMPDWAEVHRELRRPNVTLALLWEEYRGGTADGFGYSRFCELYRAWVGQLKPTLRQVHVAGERMFVDFAGQTMEVFDGATGEARRAEVFVAVLGASSYTYAEATWSQALPDWIGAHVNGLAFFAGVARQIVCDNLRSGITRACFYEPMVNRTYADMAMHYRTAVIPARPYKARDKAKVEVGVQVVQRWILARLRHRRFFSLSELNTAIRELLVQLNERPMRGWGMTRRALYEQLDRPALLPLPSTPYEYAEWKRCRVNLFCGVRDSVAFVPQPRRSGRVQRIEDHRIRRAGRALACTPQRSTGGRTHVRSAVHTDSRRQASL
jgi:transposase